MYMILCGIINKYMFICEILTYICIIGFCITLMLIDQHFLKEGQSRHWTGAILNADGEYSFRDTMFEFIGFSGNPLYWALIY